MGRQWIPRDWAISAPHLLLLSVKGSHLKGTQSLVGLNPCWAPPPSSLSIPSPPCLSSLLGSHMALPMGAPPPPGKFTRTLFSGKLLEGPWQSTSFVTQTPPFLPFCCASQVTRVMNAIQRLGTKLAITEFPRGRT